MNLDAERVRRQFENQEERPDRYTYAMEREYIQYLEEGRYEEYLHKGFPREFRIEGIGKNAHTVFKQNEYLVVTSVGLAVRAAIRVGVHDITAYDIGDIALYQLSAAKDVQTMHQIEEECISALSREIRKVKHDMKYKNYVEQSRYYIEQHIFEKIQVKNLAEEIGISPNHLSKEFSEEMHMTLTEYILREKIKIACKLLKYTNDTIPMIAEKMSMTSQSHFSMLFKRYAGITPAVYRRAEKETQRQAEERVGIIES